MEKGISPITTGFKKLKYDNLILIISTSKTNTNNQLVMDLDYISTMDSDSDLRSFVNRYWNSIYCLNIYNTNIYNFLKLTS
jgi:hypothetical protein